MADYHTQKRYGDKIVRTGDRGYINKPPNKFYTTAGFTYPLPYIKFAILQVLSAIHQSINSQHLI